MSWIFSENSEADGHSQLGKARGSQEALNERFLQVIRYSTVVATLGGCGLMMFGPAFIMLWAVIHQSHWIMIKVGLKKIGLQK